MFYFVKVCRKSRTKVFVGEKTKKIVYLLESPFFFEKDHSWSTIPSGNIRRGWYFIKGNWIDYESKTGNNKKINIEKIYLKKQSKKINMFIEKFFEKIRIIKKKIRKSFNRFVNGGFQKLIKQYLKNDDDFNKYHSENVYQKMTNDLS